MISIIRIKLIEINVMKPLVIVTREMFTNAVRNLLSLNYAMKNPCYFYDLFWLAHNESLGSLINTGNSAICNNLTK